MHPAYAFYGDGLMPLCNPNRDQDGRSPDSPVGRPAVPTVLSGLVERRIGMPLSRDQKAALFGRVRVPKRTGDHVPDTGLIRRTAAGPGVHLVVFCKGIPGTPITVRMSRGARILFFGGSALGGSGRADHDAIQATAGVDRT